AQVVSTCVGSDVWPSCVSFFFFQAEDGIRDWSVTGVQTCALPILLLELTAVGVALHPVVSLFALNARRRQFEQQLSRKDQPAREIGRASCRERAENSGGGGAFKKKEEESTRWGARQQAGRRSCAVS